MHYKVLTLVFSGWMLTAVTGCAQLPDKQATEHTLTFDKPTQSMSAQEAMSNGQSIKISTSQGEINVEPAVVSMAQTSLNSGAATGGEDDPWEGFNRAMFSFNHGAYKYVLTPVTKGYRAVVPDPARQSVGRFFDNLREPLNLLNHVFAGEINHAGSNLGRFLINTTVGVLGLFDPATSLFGLDKQPQTIGDTLAAWGVEPGPYLVLPILGQSDVRNGVSVLAEGFVHPVNHVTHAPHNYQLRAVDGVDDFSRLSDTYHTLYNEADDPYIFFRNQYLQAQKRDMWFGKQTSDEQSENEN